MSSGHKQTQQSLVHIKGSISSFGNRQGGGHSATREMAQGGLAPTELTFFLKSCHAMFLGTIIFLPSF